MSEPKKPTHLDDQGRAQMVDVAAKAPSERQATASAEIEMSLAAAAAIEAGTAKKGEVLAVARVAAIQAAKRTPELIPLCHHIALAGCRVEFDLGPERNGRRHLRIEVTARAADRTGVEMEALTAAALGALTVYDMLKAVDRTMRIGPVQLEAKSGGLSGDYRR